jgi:hypothetical protein
VCRVACSELAPSDSTASTETGACHAPSLPFPAHTSANVAGGRLTYLYPTTVGYEPRLLPVHPCLALVQDCPGETLTPFLSRRIITMQKVAAYDDSQALVYRAQAEAAGLAAGTLHSGLRDRMGEAYERWFTERKETLPAMVQQLVRRKHVDGNAADALISEPVEPALAAANTTACLNSTLSRGQLKKDAKRLVRQLRRAEKLEALGAIPPAEVDSERSVKPVTSSDPVSCPAAIDAFAAAVGWKRGRGRGQGSSWRARTESASAAGDAEAAASDTNKVAKESRRSRMKRDAAAKVALMVSGDIPMQIGQVPFSRVSAAGATAVGTPSAAVPFVVFRSSVVPAPAGGTPSASI